MGLLDSDSLRKTMPLCDSAERVSHFNSGFILSSVNPLQSRVNQGGVTLRVIFWQRYAGIILGNCLKGVKSLPC